MTDSIDTSEREAEEPRDQSRPQNWDHETATRVFVGGELLPIREMAAEPAPPPVAAGYEPHPVGTGERIRRLERDAERYRWLRGQLWTENTLAVVLRPKDNTKLGCFLPFGELLDETIDRFASGAALTSATKEQQK